MKKFMTGLSLLLLSIFTVSANAVAATIPLMIKSFPNIGTTSVELLMTLPSLGIILFSPISTIVADHIGVKRTVLLGTLLILVSGVIPAITMSFVLIFISRLVLGIGTGLLAAYSQSLIIQMYSGQEQQRMLGLASVVQGLGMFIMSYAVGALLVSSWQNSYWIYSLALPIFILVALFIPRNAGEIQTEETTSDNKKVHKEIDGKTWGFALFAFLFNTTFAFLTIKFASLVVMKGYGSVADASTLMGLMCFAMALGGVVFMFVQKHWAKYSLAVATAFASIGYLLLIISNSIILSAIGISLAGMAVSIFMASLMTTIKALVAPEQIAFTASIITAVANIGTLVSPYIAQLFASIINSSSPLITFISGLVIFIILFIGSVIFGLNYSKLIYKPTNHDIKDMSNLQRN